MFQDGKTQEKLEMKQQSLKSVNFENRHRMEDTELNFDLGDFEADFDVPQVDLNVGEI